MHHASFFGSSSQQHPANKVSENQHSSLSISDRVSRWQQHQKHQQRIFLWKYLEMRMVAQLWFQPRLPRECLINYSLALRRLKLACAQTRARQSVGVLQVVAEQAFAALSRS